MMKKMKNNQNGRTMLETLLYMGVLGVIVIMFISTIGKVFGTLKTSFAVSDLEDFVKNVRKRYALEGNYDELTIASAIEDKLVPSSMVASTPNTLKGPKFESFSNLVASGETFSFTFGGVLVDDCIEYLALPWDVEGKTGLDYIQVNSTKFIWLKGDVVDPVASYLPLDVEKISGVCKSDEENSITWSFY